MAKDIVKTEQIAYRILVEPWITEASTMMAEQNKYVFKVDLKASKNQVEKAIKDIYKVGVISVNTINIHRKKRTRGRTTGWKAGYKKAIITVKEGDKIDVFEGK